MTHAIIKFDNSDLFQETILELRKLIQGTKYENRVYLVGGGVRDLLMGNSLHDIDLVIPQENGGIEFATWLCKETDCYKENSNPVVFPKFGTAKFNIRSIHALSKIDIECVQTRKESYDDKNSRNPSVVYGTMREDAMRRDLTINALYCNISNGVVLDPTEMGLEDLKDKVLRTPSNPDVVFEDDPLRLLRVIRFSSRFNWGIERDTWLGIIKNAHRINIVSQERITDEITKILLTPTPSVGLYKLRFCGLLDKVLPEIHALIKVMNDRFGTSVFEHTLAVVDNCKCIKNARIAALFHDIGKSNSSVTFVNSEPKYFSHEYVGANKALNVLKTMKFSNADVNEIATIIRKHNEFSTYKNENPSKKVIRRFLRENDKYDIDAILALIDANNKEKYGTTSFENQVENIYNTIAEINESDNAKPNTKKPPVNGKDIMEKFGLRSGPTIGYLMKIVEQMYCENPDVTREECFEELKLKLTV